MRKTLLVGLVLSLTLAPQLFAMEAKTLKLLVFKRGEMLQGEEFVAENEQVVDYLAALKHPTGPFEKIAYRCQVKSRIIRPEVQPAPGTGPGPGSVQVNSVYSIEGCTEIN